ncbi:carboxypeptidase regulatory-like domain-containing protein [Jatrophihabitans sp. DSM 45814]
MNTPNPAAWEALAAEPIDDADLQLMSQLATLYTKVDPVPPDLVERLQFAITLDALNAELAELQQMDAMAGSSRGVEADETKTLTFTSENLTTMVTVTAAGPDRVRIDGWCAPGSGVSVELRQVSASVELQADEDGRFVFDDISHGLTRFVIRAPEPSNRAPVITPAVEI